MSNLVSVSRYYQMHGVRNLGQMLSLRDNSLVGFNLPLNSTLHVAIRNIGEIGLPEDDSLLTNLGNKILTEYVGFYANPPLGQPVKVTRVFVREVKKFLQMNKSFKWVQQSKAWVTVPAIPYVINYCSIDSSYKYKSRDGVDYWRRLNFFDTVIAGVNKGLTETTRNQFIYFDVPDLIPALSRLEEAEKQLVANTGKPLPLDKRLRTIFSSDGHHLLLELWLWAGEHSHLSIFSHIPRAQLDRIYFLTSVEDKYSVLNLGAFYSWIRSEDNPKAQLSHRRAQRVIMRHFMSLQQINAVTDETIIAGDDDNLTVKLKEQSAVIKEDTLADILKDDEEYRSEVVQQPELDVNIDASQFGKDKKLNINAKANNVKLDKVEGLNDEEDFLFDQMDKDLEQHSATAAQIEIDNLAESENVYREYSPKVVTLESKIDELANQLAAKGIYSSAEVRRARGLAERYKAIVSPFDDTQTLETYKEINPADLVIPDDNPITKKDIKGILDQSMLQYSLKDFNDKYIEQFMGKDIVNTFLHFQKAGIAITDMKMGRTDELLGSFYTLSVQLTPLVGKPSTVKFSFPVVDNNGIFKINNVHYRQKLQRRD